MGASQSGGGAGRDRECKHARVEEWGEKIAAAGAGAGAGANVGARAAPELGGEEEEEDEPTCCLTYALSIGTDSVVL